MTKAEFNEIVQDGINRSKNFMVIKVINDDSVPDIAIYQGEKIPVMRDYFNKTYDDNMTYLDGKITAVHMTNNLSDLNWFVY